MFKNSSNHLQAVRVDHYAHIRGRSRSLSFGSMSLVVLFSSAVLIWALRSWNQSADDLTPIIAHDQEPTLQAIAQDQQAKTVEKLSAPQAKGHLSREQLRKILTPFVEQGIYPAVIDSPTPENESLYFNYTLDLKLQKWAEERLSHYNPDYGVFVALDPETGKILALTSSQRKLQNSQNLAIKATYPAASTIKIITAAAALEEGVATPKTTYAFNGKSTSLYKKQVLSSKPNKWTRQFSLERAFAKSVNPIFGRIGLQSLGGDTLLKYAQQFGFNARFLTDFEFDNGEIKIDLSDEWQVAESASGYTRRNTLSPLHAATIAASIINGGYLIAPSLVEAVTSPPNTGSKELYKSGSTRKIKVLSPSTVKSMQQLMNATVKIGTGRKTFRRFFKRDYKDVIAGGKTGHLSGKNPKGSYDWFIGYGQKGEQKIAFAVLCINQDKWYVKSVQLAREALEHYFKTPNETPPKIRVISQNESIS